MTHPGVAAIDGQLATHGWRCHAHSETFLDWDDNVINWADVLAALPDLPIN